MNLDENDKEPLPGVQTRRRFHQDVCRHAVHQHLSLRSPHGPSVPQDCEAGRRWNSLNECFNKDLFSGRSNKSCVKMSAFTE